MSSKKCVSCNKVRAPPRFKNKGDVCRACTGIFAGEVRRIARSCKTCASKEYQYAYFTACAPCMESAKISAETRVNEIFKKRIA